MLKKSFLKIPTCLFAIFLVLLNLKPCLAGSASIRPSFQPAGGESVQPSPAPLPSPSYSIAPALPLTLLIYTSTSGINTAAWQVFSPNGFIVASGGPGTIPSDLILKDLGMNAVDYYTQEAAIFNTVKVYGSQTARIWIGRLASLSVTAVVVGASGYFIYSVVTYDRPGPMTPFQLPLRDPNYDGENQPIVNQPPEGPQRFEPPPGVNVHTLQNGSKEVTDGEGLPIDSDILRWKLEQYYGVHLPASVPPESFLK